MPPLLVPNGERAVVNTVRVLVSFLFSRTLSLFFLLYILFRFFSSFAFRLAHVVVVFLFDDSLSLCSFFLLPLTLFSFFFILFCFFSTIDRYCL